MSKYNLNDTLPVRTQFLIFTLFGEYVIQRGGKIWTSNLLHLMGLLGISERAVRSTLSRMRRKGWIVSQKHGRLSEYIITPRGRDLLDQGRQRIFEPIFTNWDDRWHLVVYSLPEGKRRTRHALRKNLTWLGFGRLAPGTWISPRDRRSELKTTFTNLDVDPYVDLFAGLFLGPSTAQELVTRCWDLTGVEVQYQEFVKCYRPDYIKFLECENRGQPIDQQESFVRQFWLTHEFQSFPKRDPNLPTALLPRNWIGIVARELFENYWKLLSEYANQFIDKVMGIDGCASSDPSESIPMILESH